MAYMFVPTMDWEWSQSCSVWTVPFLKTNLQQCNPVMLGHVNLLFSRKKHTQGRSEPVLK